MDRTLITKTAKAIVKEIKAELKRRKEVVANYLYADKSVDIYLDKKYDRNKAKYYQEFQAGKKYFFAGDTYDSYQISSLVIDELNELKNKSRIYKNLQYTTERVYEGTYSYYDIISTIVVPDNPCKEFKSLKSFVAKYGNITIPDYRLFSVHMGGKRGTLYGEEGDRHYLSNKPKKCADYLSQLRKARTAKDTIRCKFGQEDYIDPEEYRQSVYQEVECDGERRSYLQITITSPNGKVKFDQKLY